MQLCVLFPPQCLPQVFLIAALSKVLLLFLSPPSSLKTSLLSLNSHSSPSAKPKNKARLGVRGSFFFFFFKYRFSPIPSQNVLVRDHTVAEILLRVVRPLYARCQPDTQTPLHRHVLHRHGDFIGNGNSVKSGIRRNWDNVPFSDALHKVLFLYAVPRDVNTRGREPHAPHPSCSDTHGHGRQRGPDPKPRSLHVLQRFGPLGAAALRVRAAKAPARCPRLPSCCPGQGGDALCSCSLCAFSRVTHAGRVRELIHYICRI